jgi:hypothetical protein
MPIFMLFYMVIYIRLVLCIAYLALCYYLALVCQNLVHLATNKNAYVIV